MQLQSQTWERSLLLLAYEAHESRAIQTAQPVDSKLLEKAYAYCSALTAMHSRSFYLASSLLPHDKRQAVRALYAFCRVTDDLVDCEGGRLADVQAWRKRALDPIVRTDDPVALAWSDTRTRFHIPLRYAEQLIDGVAQDLLRQRYSTFEALANYSYGVASTVGLMSMCIIGYRGPEAIPYAIKLGVALQITNILRDVGEDWRAGRVYLPQDELEAFGLSEEDIQAGVVTDRWRNFMKFQIARNRHLYAEAWRGIGMLQRDGRFAIAAAADLYQAILHEIEAADYDVFHRRATVSKLGRIGRLPGIFLRSLLVK
jgi:phytoene synthase